MGMIVSRTAADRWRKARAREEKRWKAKSGPVTVRHVDPATLQRPQTDVRGSRSHPAKQRRFS